MAKCKWVNANRNRCDESAVKGRNGYCKDHPESGGRKNLGQTPLPSPPGRSGTENLGAIARLLYYSARLAEIIVAHWPDFLTFLTPAQLAIAKKLAAKRSGEARGKLLAELLASLTVEQWLKLAAMATTPAPRSHPKKSKRSRLGALTDA